MDPENLLKGLTFEELLTLEAAVEKAKHQIIDDIIRKCSAAEETTNVEE